MTGDTALYRIDQVRAMERYAQTALGVPGFELMQRAAVAALRVLRERWPSARQLLVLCGGGNNGGDGYTLAALARQQGLAVRVLALAPPEQLRGEARQALGLWRSAGGEVETHDGQPLAGADVLVDALLGIGASGDVRRELAQAIAAINASLLPVLALDVPSGLNGDTGRIAGCAVRATTTVTFIAGKLGLWLQDGPDHCGAIVLADLDLAAARGAAGAPALTRLTAAEAHACLPPRARTAHKGDFGRVLVVAGGEGMPGAARLSGEAALRVGAGLVTVASAPGNPAVIAGARPELICPAIESPAHLGAYLHAADIVAIGPGLGTGAWARGLLEAALAANRALLIDADALNLLALMQRPPPPGSVLTPHPGEAARLLGVPAVTVQADRMAALTELVRKYSCVVVLKGADTLVGAPGVTPALCEFGNPAMAGAGMGDVLTGAIAGVWAQCGDALRAARAAVVAHALAGDVLARRQGARCLLALDVAAELPLHLGAARA